MRRRERDEVHLGVMMLKRRLLVSVRVVRGRARSRVRVRVTAMRCDIGIPISEVEMDPMLEGNVCDSEVGRATSRGWGICCIWESGKSVCCRLRTVRFVLRGLGYCVLEAETYSAPAVVKSILWMICVHSQR